VPTASPIFRLAVGLILLTVSLLLIGDLLGLTPDQNKAELKSRKIIAEALAVQVSTDVSENRMEAVAETVRALQERNDDVLSIALRRGDGRLIAIAGDHTKHWDPTIGKRSTSSHVQVPIHGSAGLWGLVEVSFRPLDSIWASLLSGSSIATIILFISLAGFAAYWLFLKRALNELDPSAVVPDRVRTALDVLAEGLVILDRNGRMVLVNKSFERTLGQTKEMLVGNLLSALRWQDADRNELENENDFPWQQLLDSGETPAGSQLTISTHDKQLLSFAVNCSPVKAPDGRIRGVVVTFDDLTELEQKNNDLERALERLEHSQREITRQNRELHVLATRDSLTGVLNRRSLFDGMKTLMDETEASGETLSVIMVDIDHFKSINDRFGHATGDKVIKLLADILTQAVRTDDLVGRYGGEEFCVVLPGLDEGKAAEIAEDMRMTIHDGKSAKFTSAIRISASFGVSTNNGEGLEPSALVDLADKALYEAKESGRNRVKRWSELSTDGEVCAAEPGIEANVSDGPGETQRSPIDQELAKDNEKLRSRVAELEMLLGEHLGSRASGRDGNTGLPNRVVLLDRICQAMERSRRANTRMALLSVDVDSVRLVHNTHSSGAADKLMKIIGTRLRSAVRSVDTVAVPQMDDMAVSVSSMGNGEFVILLTDMHDAESTTWIVQRIFSLLEEVVEIDGSEILLDTHIGASVYPNDTDNPDDLLANASTALREARQVRERQVCLFFSKTMNQRSKQQLQIQTQLAHALDRGELYLEYQPSIDLREGRILGFEALLRWKHPERGLIRPDIFIPIAEHAGLIDRLGDWVAETAAHQLKAWHDMGCDNLSMAVNFSALQFRRLDLVERVVSLVREVGLSPSAFIVEITESTLIQNLETAVAVIEGLSDSGLRIALDDFGTGYSSLSYLKRFPIDIVKIDRSFLRDFPAQAHDTEIVSAIIAIAHNLGLQVIAEGVETERQFEVLQNLQCDEIQGFLFSKPLSRESASALLLNPSKIRRIIRSLDPSGTRQLSAEHPSVLGVINHANQVRLLASK